MYRSDRVIRGYGGPAVNRRIKGSVQGVSEDGWIRMDIRGYGEPVVNRRIKGSVQGGVRG